MAPRTHLLLYDGDCGLCQRVNLFVLERDERDAFRFAPLQGPTGRAWVERFGGDPDDLSTFRVVADHESPDARMLSRGRAGLFVLDQLGGAWRLANALRVLPTRLLDWGYGIVARNRHALGPEACPVPPPGVRWKFLEGP